MSAVAKHRVAEIRQAILHHVFWGDRSPVTAVASKLGITRQAAHTHLRAMVANKSLRAGGRAPHRRYVLASRIQKRSAYPLTGLAEDRVWSDFKLAFSNTHSSR